MCSKITRLQNHIDAITKYLYPLLPLANSHMVEFFTDNHWDNYVPEALQTELYDWDLSYAVDKFWEYSGSDKHDNTNLSRWIKSAQSHCIKVNDEYCLSTDQLQARIQSWGGQLNPEIKVTEFMTSKKSYEVGAMCGPVAGLAGAARAACCVEAGGGRAPLAAALALAHGLPCLTLDCDARKLTAAARRTSQMQKQWHAIAHRVSEGRKESVPCADADATARLHRFAVTYVTPDTDIAELVARHFPEYANTRLLLTGLHTCGALGPSSLRLWAGQAALAALVSVPCCHHLLAEGGAAPGFPMSDYLAGARLGRNARMLAAQSIDRVTSARQLPARSLLHRALLQVIIKTYLPDDKISEGRLKRLSKCENFQDYFKSADAILNLQLYDSLPQSCYNEKIKDMDCQWKKLVLFYLLRLCLAQVIESLILLDRVLFLYENGFERAYLVKLFDPVLSPRCHAIVAIR